MDLSIIIPVHSGIHQIASLFKSLHNLKTDEFKAECIFIADKCTPDVFGCLEQQCRAVGRAPGPWETWQVVKTDYGNPDRARGRGLGIATGRVVAFLDDDCRPSPGWLLAGMEHMNTHDAVTGPVRHKGGIWGNLVAVMDFGEFQPATPRRISNAPGCNLFVRANIITNRYPTLPSYRYGGDRLLANRISRGRRNIGYYPDVTVCHTPPLHPSSIWKREIRYGTVAWSVRKTDPTLPWSDLLKLGFFAVPVLAAGRLALDLFGLFRMGRIQPREKLIISLLLFVFRFAYLKGAARAYQIDRSNETRS